VLVNFPREKRAGDESAGFFADYCGIGGRFTPADGSFVLTGGEALDAAAMPVKAFWVQLAKDRDQLSARIGPADKRRFRLAELPPGTWRVMVLSDDGRAILHQGEVTLKAGETTELKIKTKKE
jgi:hypothetical protein